MPVDLSNYITVNERIRIFYELFAQGRLVTGEVRISSEPDGVPRVMVQGLAYRTPDDPLPGVGWSWMPLPGKSNFTRDSELENTETSAWGRAIASLGILIDASIASQEEVQNKQTDGSIPERPAAAPTDGPYRETEELMGDYSGTGMVRLGEGDYKLESREQPNGHAIGFRMEFKDDKAIPQVLVEGPAGEALYLACGLNPGVLRDTRIHVKGRLFSVKSNRRRQSWKRLRVSEWSNHEYTFPAKPDEALPPPLFDDLEQPPDDVSLVGEKVSA